MPSFIVLLSLIGGILLGGTAFALPTCQPDLEAGTIKHGRKGHLPNRQLARELLRLRRAGILLTPESIRAASDLVQEIIGARTGTDSFVAEVQKTFDWRFIHEALVPHERADTYLTLERLRLILDELNRLEISIHTAQLRYDKDGHVAEVLKRLGINSEPRAILTAATQRFGGLDQMLSAFGKTSQRQRSTQPATAEDVLIAFHTLEKNGMPLRDAEATRHATEILQIYPHRIRSYGVLHFHISRLFGNWQNALKAYGENPPLVPPISAKEQFEIAAKRAILAAKKSDAGTYIGRWRWTLQVAHRTMKFAAEQNLDLSATGFAEDRTGRIAVFLRSAYPARQLVPGNMIRWAEREFGSWDGWLVHYGLDPDQIRRTGSAAYLTLNDSLRKERRRNIRSIEALQYETAFQANGDDSVARIAIDPNTPQSMLEQREFSETFEKVLADFPTEHSEIVNVMIDYIERTDEFDFFSADFRDFYRERTGREISVPVLREALRRMAGSKELRELVP